MKKDLLNLIGKIENIREEFSMSGGNGIPKVKSIYDKENFLIWKQELSFELQEIYDNYNDKFIWSVLVLLKQRFNGWSDESSFNELVGSLKVIEKKIDKYYPKTSLENINEYSSQQLLDLITGYILENSSVGNKISLQMVQEALPIKQAHNDVQLLLNELEQSNIIRKKKVSNMNESGVKSNPTYYYEIFKNKESEKSMNKKPKIFISHSSHDKDIVSLIVELLEGIGIGSNQLFCSSVEGYGIPLGEDIYDYLKKQFDEYKLHVLFILSDNYYNSTPCMNEMGAAWVLKNEKTVILAPGFEFHEIKGAINPRQIGLKLDSSIDEVKEKLGELKNKITDDFSLNKIPDSRWERKRDDFISDMKELSIKTNELSTKANEVIDSEEVLNEFKAIVLNDIKNRSIEYELKIKNDTDNREHNDKYLLDYRYLYYFNISTNNLRDAFSYNGKKCPEIKEGRDDENNELYVYYEFNDVMNHFDKLNGVDFIKVAEKYCSMISGNAKYFERDFYDSFNEFKKLERYSEIISLTK